jgi:hypothetical protein
MKPIYSPDETQALRARVWDNLTRSASQAPDSAEQQALVQIDTPLVLISEMKRFAIYWAPELKAAVIRALPQHDLAELRLESAIDTAESLLADTGGSSVILDITEMPSLITKLEGAPWSQLAALAEHRILIADDECASRSWNRVTTFRQATVLLRLLGLEADDTDDAVALLRNHESVLIGGTYSGCAYWLPKTHTVAFVWGGHDADQHGCRLLYAAATAYTQFLSIQSVIVDISNRTSVDAKGRRRLQEFIEIAAAKGAVQCVIIGEAPLLQGQDASILDYLDTLRAMTRVDFVSSLDDALAYTATPMKNCALDG